MLKIRESKEISFLYLYKNVDMSKNNQLNLISILITIIGLLMIYVN